MTTPTNIIKFGVNASAVEESLFTKAHLGGKGHSLVMMTSLGIPVPPGMIIPTTVSVSLADMEEDAAEALVEGLIHTVAENWLALAGDDKLLPLMAVRSGAPISMPGMMDTILNVGITSENVDDWAKLIGDRSAWDSYRRLIQMLGSTAFDVPSYEFETILTKARREAEVETDADLDVDALKHVVERFLWVFNQTTGWDFPDAELEQMEAAVRAVFRSWYNERAEVYREMNGISHTLGTAVVVQQMVFGNTGNESATGVLFTRNPSTGEPGMFGEFLINAQGEDVVAGVRTPINIHNMNAGGIAGDLWDTVYHQLKKLCADLEAAYSDMVDIEFTIDRGTLYCLQSRVGKRAALAAFRIAVDQVEEGLITKDQAFKRITHKQYVTATRPYVDPAFKVPPTFKGLPASPGVAVGVAAFNDAQVLNSKVPTVLIRHETTPDDIKGMNAAQGILTATGGATSHAAVVARAMDKPCVVGTTGLVVGDHHASYIIAGEVKVTINQGDKVTVDGSTGNVWIGAVVPVIDGSKSEAVQTITKWAREAHGSIPQTTRPVSDVCWIAVADLKDRDDVDAMFNAMTQTNTKVILDCRHVDSYLGAADMGLIDAFGSTTPERHTWSRTAKWLIENHDLAGQITLYGVANSSTANTLEGLGYQTLRSAATMADLISGEELVVDAQQFLKLFGTEEAYLTVLDALSAKGIKPMMVRQSAHDETAVFATLSA